MAKLLFGIDLRRSFINKTSLANVKNVLTYRKSAQSSKHRLFSTANLLQEETPFKSTGSNKSNTQNNAEDHVAPVVSTEWLASKFNQSSTLERIRILDGTKGGQGDYKKAHITGSGYFDVAKCADPASEIKYMMPPSDAFEEYVGKLGICNNTHVIVYDTHNLGFYSAARVWWMFRAFGHTMVSVLDGGFRRWQEQHYSVTHETPIFTSASFKSKLNPSFVKSYSQVKENLTEKKFTLIDARPAETFEGTADKSVEKLGHIPGSINIPYASMLNAESGTLKSPEELKDIFSKSGIDLRQSVVASCGGGITGCMLILAAHLCGKEEIPLYDGSWSEWYIKAPAGLKIIKGN